MYTLCRRRHDDYSSFEHVIGTSEGARGDSLGANLGEEARNALLRDKKKNSDLNTTSPREVRYGRCVVVRVVVPHLVPR